MLTLSVTLSEATQRGNACLLLLFYPSAHPFAEGASPAASLVSVSEKMGAIPLPLSSTGWALGGAEGRPVQ